MDHRTRLSSQRFWIAGSTQCEMHLADVCCFLLPGRVEQRLQLLTLLPVFRVPHYTNYFHFAFVEPDALSQAVSIRKEPAHEGLINNRHGRCVLIISRIE